MRALLVVQMLLIFSLSAAAADIVRLSSDAELNRYWVFNPQQTIPLLEAAGTQLVVPRDVSQRVGKWEKTFKIRIDADGKVVMAECVDCSADDPVKQIMQRSLLLNRYKPAPGNVMRVPVEAPTKVTLNPAR